MSYAHETCCAHLKIQYCKESLDDLTHDWWECASCKMLFAPQGRASLPQWIPISERMPTREDADNRGKVLWAYPDGVVTVGDFDSPYSNEHGDGWMPLPPYAPPKPGPTDEEIRMLFSIFARRNSWAFKDIRRWFDEVTARIEREKQT